MKIRRLKLLSQFRGLHKGFEFNFTKYHCSGDHYISPLCFVGLNGTGKSNVLEVLAEMFYYLETYHKAKKEDLQKDLKGKSHSKRFQSPFGFELEYELPISTFKLANVPWPELIAVWEKSDIPPIISIKKECNQFPRIEARFTYQTLILSNDDFNRNAALLPSHIIAYSSGMNELLSNPFIKMDFDYFEEIKDKRGFQTDLNLNRLFSLNYDSSKFITICNWLFDADGFDKKEMDKALDFGGINLSRIKSELGLKDIKCFNITIKVSKQKNETDYLPLGLNTTLEELKRCATFVNEHIDTSSKNEDHLHVELIYWVNKATKEAFHDLFKRADSLFNRLYFLNLLNNQLVSPKIRKEISEAKAGTFENLSDELPKFEVDQKIFAIGNITFVKSNGAEVHYRKLSDGEHQLLHVFGAILLMNATGALFLFDEPETHFNPEWRSKFIDLLNSSIYGNREQEIILTTHSPYIVSDCQRHCVYKFKRGLDGRVQTPVNPNINTFGSSIDIISQEVFEKDDTISELSKKLIEKIKEMPLDTLEDIIKAKEASRVLGESVEKVLLFHEFLIREKELKK